MENMEDMMLPTELADMIGVEQSIPKVNFTEHMGLLISEPKWGKTTIGSLLPRSIFFPFEKGDGSAVIPNRLKKLNCWEDFVNFINVFEMNREKFGDRIRMAVFDTANEMWSFCENYIIRRESLKSNESYKNIGDIPHGKGYTYKTNEFNKQIKRLIKLGVKPFFITHSKTKTIRPKSGDPYEISSTTMDDRLSAIIMPLVDYIISGQRKTIINPDTGESKRTRVLVNIEDGMVTAGGRNYLNVNIPFDTEQEAIEKFQEVFKEGIKKKLADRGINRDFDELAKEQEQKSLDEAIQYASEHVLKPKDECIAEIREKVKADPKIQTLIVKYMQDNNVTLSDDTDIEHIRDMIDIIHSAEK